MPVLIDAAQATGRVVTEASADAATVTPARIEVALTSRPSGAVVLRNGQRVGTTPYRAEFEQGTEVAVYRIEAPGHVGKEIRVSHEDDVTQQVELVALRDTRSDKVPGGGDKTGGGDKAGSGDKPGGSGDRTGAGAGSATRTNPGAGSGSTGTRLKPRPLDCQVVEPGRPRNPFDKRPVCK